MKKNMKKFLILVTAAFFFSGSLLPGFANELTGFDKAYYLTAKLTSLQDTYPDWVGKDVDNLESFLTSAGFTAESHYSQYGYLEGLEPNQYFSHSEYVLAKATAMYNSGMYSSVAEAETAFNEAWPYDAYQHYCLYGAAEGINPSNSFDESDYLSDKLAALQETSPEWHGKTVDQLRTVLFDSAGMTVLDHYLSYGQYEGLSVTPVTTELVIDVSQQYKTVVTDEKVWEFLTDERTLDYEYADQWYPGTVVSFFPQAQTIADFWANGLPDILVPLNKGYASGIDTRFKPLLFKNDGTHFSEASAEVTGDMPAIPGLRRVEAFVDQMSGISGIFGVAHDTGDGNSADALLLTAGDVPQNLTSSLPKLPLADIVDRNNAVDAHSLAGGDLTGNGLTDFIIGEWRAPDGPYKLIQETAGNWVVEQDSFLRKLAFEQPLVTPTAGEGNNLLLDLHLADFDGDGFADLVAGWGHGSSNSYVYLNDGEAGFSNERQIQLPQSVYGIDNNLHMKTKNFDFGGDGDLDLLIIHSRYEPYYGGYTLQLLKNEGGEDFSDVTSSALFSIPERERTFSERLEWSDNFYLIDVNQDGFVDIVGSDFDGIRLWLSNGRGEFFEITVNTLDQHQGGIYIFVDMGDGRISSLIFRQGWTDAEGTENRVWFEQVDLIQK